MHRYGIRGANLEWFRSYLDNRSQIVKINNVCSDIKATHCGVPQGSVLGPILFLLYINDLTTININGSFTIFADDTTLLWHGKNTEILKQVVSSDLSKVKQWCDSNFLCFNVDKTKIVNFKFSYDNLQLDGINIAETHCTRFLGLHIDNKLKFNEHITSLCKKLASGSYAVRVVANELDISTARSTYFALVESHLRYGIAFWGFCNQELLNQVFVLQKRSLRYLCRANYRDSCRHLFVQQRILTVVSIFILEVVCLIHKRCVTDTREDRSYNTRQSRNHNIHLPIPKLNLTKHSNMYEGKKIFNNLPQLTKIILDHKIFRKSVKNLLLEKAYYSLQEYYVDMLQRP